VTVHNKPKDCWLIINGKVRSFIEVSWKICSFLFFLVLLLILWFDLSEPWEEIWDLWMWLTSGRAVYWFDLGFRLRFKWD
jgi:hypothetical protein